MIGNGPARFHLDIETDDVDAEVASLAGLGAVKVASGRTWVVMRDPSGLVFDVVPLDTWALPGDPSRRAIIERQSGGSCTETELAQDMTISRPGTG